MITTSLPSTKFFIPPTHPHLVSRPLLIQRLEEGLHLGNQLTLVSAQAGSGKTTLLSEWSTIHIPRAHSETQTVWISLDEEDNDPIRFWLIFFAAFQNVHAGLRQEELQLLQGRKPALSTLLTPLINALTQIPQKIVLTLDDYHVISNQEIHDGIAFLLERQPSQLHLVVSTRTDPPLPIAQLRAHGRLTELRVADLRFTTEEIRSFLIDKLGLELAPDEIQKLAEKTEGWIVGLQLAAHSLRGRSDVSEFITAFTGTHRYILDYLSDEVIRKQPESVYHFLMRTSILDQLCGALCDAVAEENNSRVLLAQLQHANLFITPLDDEDYWYRYHPLFADLLQMRLQRELSTEAISELHLRASIWHDENGSLRAAVNHALKAKNYQRVTYLAERAIQASVLDSRLTILLNWLGKLPEDVLETNLRLRIYRGLALFLDGAPEQAQEILQEARLEVSNLASSSENRLLSIELTRLLDTIEATMAGLWYGLAGNVEKSTELTHKAKDWAEEADNAFLAALAYEGLALISFMQGDLQQSASFCHKIIKIANEISKQKDRTFPLPLAAMGYVQLAGIYIEWNDLDAARDHITTAISMCQGSGGDKTLVEAFIAKSRLKQARGDMEAAIATLSEAEQMCSGLRSNSLTNFRLLAQKARLNLTIGNTEDVFQWTSGHASAQKLWSEPLPLFFKEIQQLLLARVYLAHNRAEKALTLLAELQTPAENAGRVSRVIEITWLKGLAFQLLEDIPAALEMVEASLTQANPGGFVRLFLDEGEPAVRLLTAFCLHSHSAPQLTSYGNQLLKEAEAETKTAPKIEEAAHTQLVEPLTQREREVLQLVYRGYSNQEIAEELVLALNTVKRHTSNIYGKLGVKSRTQAIAQARKLGLISSDP